MPKLIKKHMVAVYVNSGTSDVPNWIRIRKATEFNRAMNATTEDRDYIADEYATTELLDYKPSEDLTVTTYKGEQDFDLLYDLYKKRAVGDDAKREFMLVYIFDSSTVDGITYYAAEKTNSTLVLNEFNTSSSTISATVYENGTATTGYVTYDEEDGTPTFTAGAIPTSSTSSSTTE